MALLRNFRRNSITYVIQPCDARARNLETQIVEDPNRLVRAIGRWSLAALMVNIMIGSGIFGFPSVLAGLLGRDSLLALLLGSVAAGVIGACFSEGASYFTVAGGPYL
jgi:amino acid transporter